MKISTSMLSITTTNHNTVEYPMTAKNENLKMAAKIQIILWPTLMGCNFGTTYLLVFIFWDVSQNDNLYSLPLKPHPYCTKLPQKFQDRSGKPVLPMKIVKRPANAMAP